MGHMVMISVYKTYIVSAAIFHTKRNGLLLICSLDLVCRSWAWPIFSNGMRGGGIEFMF